MMANINMLNAKINYSVNIGYPYEYGNIYEWENSYFMDVKGEPLIYFGGSLGAGNEWGSGSQNTVLSAVNPLPAGIKVRWFSISENQFWEGEYQFDREQLAQLFETEVWNVFYQKKLKYERATFVVYVVPGGLVTVWVRGAGQQKFLAQFQAQKIEMNWEDFAKPSVRVEISRQELLTELLDEKSMPERAIANREIKAGTLSIDSARWKRRMWTYSWVLTVSEPFQVKDYLGWYVNGERYYTYADDAPQNKFRPMPYFFSVYIEKPDKTLERFTIELKEAEVMAAFKKLSGSLGTEPTEIYFELAEDRQIGAVYLRNKTDKVELTAEISLQDLYNKSQRQ